MSIQEKPAPPRDPHAPRIVGDRQIWDTKSSLMDGLGIAFMLILLIAVSTLLFGGLVMWSDSFNKNKQAENIANMQEVASRIKPGGDWKATVENPINSNCRNSTVVCPSFQQIWNTSGNVSITDLEKDLRINLLSEGFQEDCYLGSEGSRKIEICVFNSSETPQLNVKIK